MPKRLSPLVLSIAIVSGLFLLQPAGAAAQALPRSATIGTNPPSTLFYSLAGGLAKVVSGATPMQASVQPYTGTSTFLPLINNGEVEFGVINAVDLGLAYRGERFKIGGRNPFPHSPAIRLVMRGAPLLSSLVVRKDSPIKTVYDVKGRRVTGEYPAHLAVWYAVFSALANGGLTWDDVKVVPVPAVNEGVDALVQGRADVSNHAIGSAKIKEADAAIGVRYVNLDCSPAGEERIRKSTPGYYMRTLKGGFSTGIIQDTCVLAYDIYFLGHKALPDIVVQATLKAIWENIDQLPPLHPGFQEWTRERAVDADVTIPYHPAAIQFYKERKLWSARSDEAQARLLALNK